MKEILGINLILLILLILICCKKNNVSDLDRIDKINNKVVIIDNKLNLLNYSKICNCGKGSLEVKTDYYNIQDTLNSRNYIIVNQELIFSINKKIIKTIRPPYEKLKRVIDNKNFYVPVTDVYSVKCIKNKEEYIYKIYGGNLYDPPHEFFSINNLEGDWLWYFYGNSYDTYKSFISNKFDIKKIEKQMNNLDDMIVVVPDKF